MAKDLTSEERALLCDWIARLTEECGLEDVTVPLEDLLDLAGAVASGVARPAVPVTAYLAGYAAAMRAEHSGGPGPARTVRDVRGLVPVPVAAKG